MGAPHSSEKGALLSASSTDHSLGRHLHLDLPSQLPRQGKGEQRPGEGAWGLQDVRPLPDAPSVSAVLLVRTLHLLLSLQFMFC